MAGAPRSLLPTSGAIGLGSSPHRHRRICVDDRMWQCRVDHAQSAGHGAMDRTRNHRGVLSSADRADRHRLAQIQGRTSDMRFNWRMWLAFGHDLAACAAAWLISFWLRFNLELPNPFGAIALESLAWVVPLHAALFLSFGLYRGIWRFASLPDLKRIIGAVAVAAVAVPTVFFMLQITVPRSVLIMNPLLLVMLMGGSRFAYRMWKEQGIGNAFSAQGEPVAVIGAGEAAVNLIKELARSTQWRIAAAFDDNAANIGRELHGVRVLSAIAALPAHCKRLGIQQAIIAMPDASHTARRRAVEICSDAGLKVMTVPSYDDLVGGKITISQIRHVELDDLLGRDPVVLDPAGLGRWIGGRCIMVPGAGGSIGAELCRQIARFKPARLVLFESS